jgi:hypothetical protein
MSISLILEVGASMTNPEIGTRLVVLDCRDRYVERAVLAMADPRLCPQRITRRSVSGVEYVSDTQFRNA